MNNIFTYRNIIIYGYYLMHIINLFIIIGINRYISTGKSLSIIYNYIHNVLLLIISIIIIYYFNPYKLNKKKKINDFERTIIFNTGLFILYSSSISAYIYTKFNTNYLNNFINDFSNDFSNKYI